MKSRLMFAILSLVLTPNLVESIEAQSSLKGKVKTLVLEKETDDYERRITTEESFSPEGTTTARTSYLYSYRDHSLNRKLISTLDDRGKVIAQVRVGPEGERLGRTMYRYDEHGTQTELIVYDGEGNVTERTETSYNSDRTEGETKTFRKDKLYRRVEYACSGQGKACEVKQYNEDGNLSQVSRRNELGKTIESLRYAKDGSLRYRGTAEYDSEGRLISTSNYDPEGSLTSERNYSYNAEGLIEKEVETQADGPVETVTYTYEFDQQGNWTKQTRISTGMRPSNWVVYRTFTYH